jgi:hypothetical protein
LHQFVTGGYTNSVAEGIGDDGTIVGLAYTNDGARHMVMWVRVPEPAVAVTLAAGAGLVLRPRHRRRGCS